MHRDGVLLPRLQLMLLRLCSAVRLLTTRLEKIEEYKKAFDLKIAASVKRFNDYHYAILAKNEKYYRSLSESIHGIRKVCHVSFLIQINH